MNSPWFIWLLILSFCLQAMGQTLVLGRFYLHRAEIERTRCENRLKPELQCHGKCQLRKELASNTREQEPSQTTPEIRQWLLDLPAQIDALPVIPGHRVQCRFQMIRWTTTAHLPDIFHPPCASILNHPIA